MKRTITRLRFYVEMNECGWTSDYKILARGKDFPVWEGNDHTKAKQLEYIFNAIDKYRVRGIEGITIYPLFSVVYVDNEDSYTLPSRLTDTRMLEFMSDRSVKKVLIYIDGNKVDEFII